MTQTPNYNLNIVEGSDVVNPLVQMNPNFTQIDTVMKTNEGRGVATASEVKSGINHAITRNVANAVFRFVATSDFRTGDTFSVDGNTVTVSLASGENPKDRAFVVGTSVICILDGTRLTLVNCEANIPGIDASDVNFDNAGTDLAGTNVEDVIKEVNNKTIKEYVSVDIDGVKNWSQLFNSLYSEATLSKITENAKIVIDRVTSKLIYALGYVDGNRYSFMYTIASATSIETSRVTLYDDSDFLDYNSVSGPHNYSSNVPSNTEWKIKLYY